MTSGRKAENNVVATTLTQGKSRIAFVRAGELRFQHHLATLCQYLTANGFELEFFSLQAPREDVAQFAKDVPGIRTVALGQWGGNGLSRFFRGGMVLRKALSLAKFDILYVVDSWTLRYLAVATFGLMRWKGRPFVYHTFDMLVPNVAKWADIALERHATRRSSLNVNTDRSRAEVVKVLYSLGEVPIAVPLRVRLEAQLPEWNEVLRRSLIQAEPFETAVLIVAPTRLSCERMSRELIESFSYLPANYHLVTIDSAGEYAEKCHEVITHNRLGRRIHVLPQMPHNALLEICACSDVGIIFHNAKSSLGNHLSHSGRLAYFIALGLPVVANDVPVLEAIVYRYQLGVCCSPESPAEIAKAIRNLCEDDVSLPTRRQRIRSAFISELHYEKRASHLIESLAKLAGRSRGGVQEADAR